MSPVIDETGNVVLGHLWKLLLKDTFQPSKDDEAVAGIVVVHDSEFYFPSTLFDDGRLNAKIGQRHKTVRRPYNYLFGEVDDLQESLLVFWRCALQDLDALTGLGGILVVRRFALVVYPHVSINI